MKKTWFDYVRDNQDKFWVWYDLSANPNVTWDIVQANPDYP